MPVSGVGWGIIAVPTGIVTSEMTARRMPWPPQGGRVCSACRSTDHETDAKFCKSCGAALADAKPAEPT